MGVTGIELFRNKFKDYTDCYTIIGGTACDILMAEADLDFRATRDIDMIILFEDRYKDFAKVFWEFVKEGGYRCGWKNSEDVHFYRFTEPTPGYPSQIELFSRKPDYHLGFKSAIVPVYISDDISSLSAIMLNDDFYEFMMNGRKTVNGVSVLSAEYIIPFKMFAWLNLKDRKAEGEHVNSRDLKKHKYDVFRLLQIVSSGTEISSTGLVHETICRFISEIENEEMDLFAIGLGFSKEQGVEMLKQVYLKG